VQQFSVRGWEFTVKMNKGKILYGLFRCPDVEFKGLSISFQCVHLFLQKTFSKHLLGALHPMAF
jgi:hypothetical protein